jgi:hypothetical protein
MSNLDTPKIFLSIALPPIGGLGFLAAFAYATETFYLSLLAYLVLLGLFTTYAILNHEAHHREGAYDDRLSSEKMEVAREKYFEDHGVEANE